MQPLSPLLCCPKYVLLLGGSCTKPIHCGCSARDLISIEPRKYRDSPSMYKNAPSQGFPRSRCSLFLHPHSSSFDKYGTVSPSRRGRGSPSTSAVVDRAPENHFPFGFSPSNKSESVVFLSTTLLCHGSVAIELWPGNHPWRSVPGADRIQFRLIQ